MLWPWLAPATFFSPRHSHPPPSESLAFLISYRFAPLSLTNECNSVYSAYTFIIMASWVTKFSTVITFPDWEQKPTITTSPEQLVQLAHEAIEINLSNMNATDRMPVVYNITLSNLFGISYDIGILRACRLLCSVDSLWPSHKYERQLFRNHKILP